MVLLKRQIIDGYFLSLDYSLFIISLINLPNNQGVFSLCHSSFLFFFFKWELKQIHVKRKKSTMSVQSKLYVSITENKEREKSTGIGKTPWRNDCWRHQSSAKQMDKGLNSGQVSGGHLNTAWQSSSPFHTDSRLYTSSFLLTPLRVRVEKGILLESFQWDKLPPFQNTKWTAQMKCAMLSVAFNNLLLFVGHPCSLITHFTVFLEVSSSSVGRGPSQPPFLTRKWQEIGLSDWRALSRQWIQASHLRKICTHQFSPVLGQVKRQATWAAGWESKSPTFNRSWRE